MDASTKTGMFDIAAYDLHAAQPVLRVRDVEATANWYRDVLGFTIDFLWGDPIEHGRVYAVDHATRVAIQLTAGLADGIDPRSTGWTMIHVGKGIDELYQVYRERGVVVVREIDDRPWGMRDFDITDFNGYVLRFAGEA
jgi:catechol 2,3-dioxygenase-like lactoylglutathione lyase family enzyme